MTLPIGPLVGDRSFWDGAYSLPSVDLSGLSAVF